MQLSKYEMESIVNWNQAEKVAYVFTHDKPLIHKLEQWSKELTSECRLERVSHDGQAVDYVCPRSWIHVHPPRKSAPMSEERRAELRERLEAVRKAKKTDVQT